MLPGSALFGYYDVSETFEGPVEAGGVGDNILRLVNPSGNPNGNLGVGRVTDECAMIYVFDDDEEMGECCGCPLTSAQLGTFSVERNLTSDWALQGGTEGGDHANGAIAIVAASPNALSTCTGQSGACHGGCDPTNVPGYSVTTANNLLGSITHNQLTVGAPGGTFIEIAGVTETALSDDAGGDPADLVYLETQCGALIGNGSLGGICNCPIE